MRKKNSLGDWYEKIITFSEKLEVKSPVKGKIGKIYLNNSMSLISDFGLEIILLLEVIGDTKNFQLKPQKNSEETLDTDEVIFIIESKSKSVVKATVSVIIPWQPQIIRKVEKGLISYKNPLFYPIVKNVCSY